MLFNPVDEVRGCLERDDHLEATFLLHFGDDFYDWARRICYEHISKFTTIPSGRVRKRAQETLTDILALLGRERLQLLAYARFRQDRHDLPCNTERGRRLLEVSLIPDLDGNTRDELLELRVLESLSNPVQIGILATFGADNLPAKLERDPLLNRALVPGILWAKSSEPSDYLAEFPSREIPPLLVLIEGHAEGVDLVCIHDPRVDSLPAEFARGGEAS